MKTIGRYIIRGLLGKGQMGKVYRVELPPIGKIYALKKLDPDPLLEKLLGAANIKALFLSEAMTLAGINHPNVVEVVDYYDDGSQGYYVMGYHPDNLGQLLGETYLPEIPSRILPTDKAINYALQILAGLACLHHFGIIHRDIKPFNVLITENETLKLCDFGLSKVRGEAFKGPSNLNVGSPFYAPPEQEDDPDKVDFSADLYSTGVMIYRMLTGRLPLSASRFMPASALNPELDDLWNRFFDRALNQIPKNRFQRAEEMTRHLDGLAEVWQKRREQVCRLFEKDETAPRSSNGAIKSLRHKRIKTAPSTALNDFGLDSLFRPRHYLTNQFVVLNEALIEDQATGLIWQRSGSPYPLTWHEGRTYVARLNQERFGQLSDWRLPTIAELCSLLTDLPRGEGLCIPPIFDPQQKSLWSDDLRSYSAAWLVYLELGFVHFQDFSARYHVRAVYRRR